MVICASVAINCTVKSPELKMPKLTAEIKKQIKALSKTDLEQIALKCTGRDKYWYEYVYVHFLNPEYGEEDLFEDYKLELDKLSLKSFPGRLESMRLTRLLKASNTLIRQFHRIGKKPHLEVELYLYALDMHFDTAAVHLGGHYQVYDNNIARTLKKVLTMIREKLHDDYLLEYRGRINGYLLTLHRLAPFNAIVKELPRAI